MTEENMNIAKIMDDEFGDEWDGADCRISEDGVLSILGDTVSIEGWDDREVEAYVRDAIEAYREYRREERAQRVYAMEEG